MILFLEKTATRFALFICSNIYEEMSKSVIFSEGEECQQTKSPAEEFSKNKLTKKSFVYWRASFC